MENQIAHLETELSRHIWENKYRYSINGSIKDKTIEDTWRRVASAMAKAECQNSVDWEEAFFETLSNFKFLPGGRIIAGAGTERNVTLFNCFVMGVIDDSISSIFDHVKEGALTLQWGGGIGCDFSTLRPKGSLARSTNNISSGPVSFMKIWDAMCDTMLSTGARRGAMMGTLRCDHPDIQSFIDVKKEPGILTNFNLSVLITEDFVNAVNKDEEWLLVFPEKEISGQVDKDAIQNTDSVYRKWPGFKGKVPCRVFGKLKAKKLWAEIMKANYNCAEPGVLFIDRINALNNLKYTEDIFCTNPCGEVPLPPYGACNLGSINLTQFIKRPFTKEAAIDMEGVKETARLAVRMLDNVISISNFPLEKQKIRIYRSRRIGVGITGLADALIMMNKDYGSNQGREMAENIMREISHEAYRSSIELAKTRGSFPDFKAQAYLKRPFIKQLPASIQQGIKKYGIRNSHLLSIAPTGSISLLAGNVSSGLEPIFDYEYSRNVLNPNGSVSHYRVRDFAYRLWVEKYGSANNLPDAFVRARELSPLQHLKMQAVLQRHVDNSISKTIHVPESYSYSSFKNIYKEAYDMKLKGCTTYRTVKNRSAVLSSD
ncbi:adenosylcobalamin-dependent ribonucleoside-diphosphate reductase [Balneolaceae bacterium YR4-1]|uniref:Vitamin B12-dependent ribonucleotide reductase n=1 Tax=Halalkalibaculum roseum TaxID=2709311 RepID=A0A6M1SZF4_9BACT|nr:adenosylcobalamin-dependent ribonucleoside-diphosphate reductase [Halalkalibaculum roseum]